MELFWSYSLIQQNAGILTVGNGDIDIDLISLAEITTLRSKESIFSHAATCCGVNRGQTFLKPYF